MGYEFGFRSRLNLIGTAASRIRPERITDKMVTDGIALFIEMSSLHFD